MKSVSEAEATGEAGLRLDEEECAENQRPSPAEALQRLQAGEGIDSETAAAWIRELEAERMAKRYWWEPV